MSQANELSTSTGVIADFLAVPPIRLPASIETNGALKKNLLPAVELSPADRITLMTGGSNKI